MRPNQWAGCIVVAPAQISVTVPACTAIDVLSACFSDGV